MATAVFFLLFGTWMEELALAGMRWPTVIGIVSLAACVRALIDYRHEYEAASNPPAALAALARATRSSAPSRPARPVAVRLVR